MSYTVNTFGEVEDLTIVAPTTADTDPTFEDNVLEWVNGDGEQRLVIVCREATDIHLFDGVTYPVNRGIKDVGVVIFRGSGNSVNLLDFFSSGTFTAYIIPFNGQSSNEVYFRGEYESVEFTILEIFDETFDESFE